MATTRNMIGEKWEEVMGWHGVGFLFSYLSQALEGNSCGDSFGSR